MSYIIHGIQTELTRKLASGRFFPALENHTDFIDSCD